MSVPYWPETLPQVPVPGGWSGSPMLARSTFEPDVGEPIGRPRMTGAVWSWSGRLPPLTLAQRATLKSFVETDLAQGTARFVWRCPLDGLAYWWKFPPQSGYSVGSITPALVGAGIELLQLPVVPWFAPYVYASSSKPPAFVADYDGGVYGVGADPTAAAALEDVAGTYLVARTTGSGTTEAEETLTAGDITSAQPAGTLKIVGWAV